MSVRKCSLIELGLGLLSLSMVLTGCSHERQALAASPETVGDLAVLQIQKSSVPNWLEVVGTTRAVQTSQLASQIMGNIVTMNAQEGERVEAGQLLAVIDDAQPRAGVEQAAAAELAARKDVVAADSEYNLAESTLHRYQQLYERQTVSPLEFDQVKARAQSAEARRDMARAILGEAGAALAQARTLLGHTQIHAPFPGLVTERKADVGTLASPGMPIFTLEDTRRYRLEVTVDETDVQLVRLGQSASANIDALGESDLSGKVVQIVPTADPRSRSFLVKLDLPRNSRLRSGLFGRARFLRGPRTALLIPRTAVVDRGQLQAVYVLDAEQIAGIRYITVANGGREQVEVLSGLEAGERLIVAPGDRELGGKRIAGQL